MATTKTKIGNLFFNFRGEWDSTKTYIKDDVVLYNNSDYVCVKNTDSTNDVPKENKRRYVRVTKAVSASTGADAYKWDGQAAWPVDEEQFFVGDTLVLNQDGNDFDDNKIAFSNSSSNKASNLYHENVTYYLDGKAVGNGTGTGEYFNASTFNNASKREIRIEITNDTPKTFYMFNYDNASANFGPKIVVADQPVWKLVRSSFKWRGEHDNTNASGSYLTYYPNDIVRINVPIDNDFSTNNQYDGNQINQVRATYICILEHTTDGTSKYLPWDQESDTDGNKYWERVSEEMQFDDEIVVDSGSVGSITNISAASPARQQGFYPYVNCINVTAEAENSNAGRTGGHNTPMFNVTVEGYQSVKSVGNFGSAHYKRKPGVYKNLTQSATSGAGSNANFDIIVDEFGAVTSVTVTKKNLGGQMGGLGYAQNETLTIADSSLGGGGAPDFTFDVLTIGTWGALNIEIARDQKASRTGAYDTFSNRWDGDEESPLLGGENNAVNDQLRIDGQVFYSSANVTFDVASTTKKARGYQNRYSGNRLECMSLCNTSGPIGDDHRLYRLPGQFQQGQCVDWPCFINGRGGITSWGSNSNGQNGLNQGSILSGVGMVFPFLDWYRSTDNGGTGIHTTPDGEVPKAIQLLSGYETGMALFNNGEVYHWGYGGHGQSGDASTSNRSYPARCGGTYQEVFLAANTSTHTLRDTRIKRIYITNWGGDNNGTNTHSCYALDTDGELWAWGYNGYGQLGQNNTSDLSRPTKINKTTYFNGNKIDAFWTAGAGYAFCFALDVTGKLYSWGYNGYGVLAHGNTTNLSVPTEITGVTFDNGASNPGKIKKLLVDSQQSYQRVAILTEKGKIFWCGRNEYGWAMMGNTSDVNTFTQMANGPGSGTHSHATNMWFTGNGRYGSFWTKDQTGAIKCCGYNGNYELGIGNTSNQSSAVEPKWQVNTGTTSTTVQNLENIKDIGCNSAYGNQWMCSVHILTYDGFMFTAGRNNYGIASQGWSSSYAGDRQANNNIEETDDYYFQMCRMPNYAHGRIEDIRGRGYYSSDGNRYHFKEIKTFDNRYLLVGYGGNYIMGQNDGNYHSMFQPPVLV